MESKKTDRREFLVKSGKFAAIAALAGFATENASAGLRYEMDSSAEGRCATCKFWGGIRKLSKDSKVIKVHSLGWCNNPNSPNYHKTTTPETGPMKAWRKWDVIS